MGEVLYQLVSSSNFAEFLPQIAHKPTRSIIGWESTDYAVAPIELLFKLQTLTFVTEFYLHPKRGKNIGLLQVKVSENNNDFASIAKIYDFNDAVRVQVAGKCRYVKLVILEKEHGKPASIDLLRIYGHPYFKYQDDSLFYSQRKQKIDQLLISEGLNRHERYQVDQQTVITLHDMSLLRQEVARAGSKQKLNTLINDFKTVLQLGKRIKKLEYDKKYLSAKDRYGQIRDINDQLAGLKQRRDFYDQKYQTRRFEEMIKMEDGDSQHQEMLKKMLEKDKEQLEWQRKRREEEARRREEQLEAEFDGLNNEDDQWWRKEHQLDKFQQFKPAPKVKQVKKPVQPDYTFKNPYVYNQGDADMQKYIQPLLNQFGADNVADPQLLRKYEQLEYLDILGARIWISAHSQNWRQRAAAIQAVLKFSMDKLPQRYRDGRTKNLFLALMEFARINAQDKVLQIYYTSLKIMAVALQPPICGQDVPPALVNKTLQKFMSILIQKISQMNSRAKEISLKQLITIFKHPAAQLSIAVNQCLKICKEELNVKFTPVDKQNPRLIISRIQIIAKLMKEFSFQKRHVDMKDILMLLVEGSLYHSSQEVRMAAAKLLQDIHRIDATLTTQWYKSLRGLKPNIAAQLQEKLKIR